MAIPQMLCRAGLTTDYSVLSLLGILKTRWKYDKKKEELFTSAWRRWWCFAQSCIHWCFCKGGGATTNLFCSLWIICHTSIFFGRMQSFKFVVGPGLVHGVEVWMDSNLHPFGISCNTTFLESQSSPTPNTDLLGRPRGLHQWERWLSLFFFLHWVGSDLGR